VEVQLQQRRERIYRVKALEQDSRDLRARDAVVLASQAARRVRAERGAIKRATVLRRDRDSKHVDNMRSRRQHDRQMHYIHATERAATQSFITQQNMIARRLQQGMFARYKDTEKVRSAARTTELRRQRSANRAYVRGVLLDNWLRRRQNVHGGKLETQHNLQIRALSDVHKLELLKTQRRRMLALRDVSTSHSARSVATTAAAAVTAAAAGQALVPAPPSTAPSAMPQPPALPMPLAPSFMARGEDGRFAGAVYEHDAIAGAHGGESNTATVAASVAAMSASTYGGRMINLSAPPPLPIQAAAPLSEAQLSAQADALRELATRVRGEFSALAKATKAKVTKTNAAEKAPMLPML
jgi:hypothetical protein